MPLHCPRQIPGYNACLDCRNRHDNECWADMGGVVFANGERRSGMPVSEKLANILTIEERIALLEDRPEVPPVDIVVISHKDYQQLVRFMQVLEEKINAHTIATGKKPPQWS